MLKAEATYSIQGSPPCPGQWPQSNVLFVLLIVGIIKKAQGVDTLLRPPRSSDAAQRHGQGLSRPTYQFLGPHVIEDPLGILTVMPAFHDGQEQLGCVVLIGDTREEEMRRNCQGVAGLNYG